MMGAQFGTTKIGAMQYNGQTISEAMYNGQIVYQSYVSPYPLSGEWSGTPAGSTVMASHTIVESGTFTLTHTVTGHGFQLKWSDIRGPWGTTAGTDADPSIATVTLTLTAGDVIEFMAGSGVATFPVNGSWSITKN